MPRTFAYLRVSTTGQTTDNQLQEIKAAGFKSSPAASSRRRMGAPSRSQLPSSGAYGTQPRLCCRSRTTAPSCRSSLKLRFGSSHPHDDAEAELAEAEKTSEVARGPADNP